MKSSLRTIFIFSMVMNLLWLFPALYSLQVFDRVLTSRSTETLLVLLLGVVIILVILGCMDFLRSRLQGVLGNIINDSISPEIARITLAIGARRQGGFTQEGLRDVSRLRAVFSSQGLVALFDAPWAIVYILVIGLANLWLGVLAFFSAVLLLGLAFANARITSGGIEELQKEAGRGQRFLDQAMGNAEVAQAMGMADALVKRWNSMSLKVVDLQDPLAQRTVTMGSVTRIARQMTQILMTSLGAFLVVRGETTAGVMIAAAILLGKALQPVELLVGSWKTVAEGRLAWSRLGPLLEESRAAKPQMSLPAPQGGLTAAGVMYRAPRSERTLLAGISVRLEPGESMGIVGPSGAGKSTLVRLLIGLWAPTQGQIRLDGVDLSTWPREEIGPHIGYMPQDVELFTGSVAENIGRMGEPDSDKVVAAAKLARVHEMVLALPEGYDTHVDPNSAVLSPGQRQRVALARALYGNPTLIVLDEPNANLDGAGEQALAETLRELQGKATVVVVTHRPSLTQHVQKLLMLEGGRQIHFGRTEDVLAALRAAASSPDGQVVPMLRGAPQDGGGRGAGAAQSPGAA